MSLLPKPEFIYFALKYEGLWHLYVLFLIDKMGVGDIWEYFSANFWAWIAFIPI